MRFIAGLIFGILMVIFIFQNVDVVTIKFLFWTIPISRALLIFVVFLSGIILGVLFSPARKPKQKPELPESAPKPVE